MAQDGREQVLDESLVEVHKAHRQHGGEDANAGDGRAVKRQGRQAGRIALRDVVFQVEGIEARHERRWRIQWPIEVHAAGDALGRRALVSRKLPQHLQARPIECAVVEESVLHIRHGCFPQAQRRVRFAQRVVVAARHRGHRGLRRLDALPLVDSWRHSKDTSKMDGQSLPVR